MRTPELGRPTLLTADAPWPRLDHFLTARLDGLSRTVVQSLIKGGRVQVDGETVLKARAPLAGGERITVGSAPREPSRLAPQEMPLDVLHEDDQIIVLNKPAGLVTHPGGSIRNGTLANGLAARFEQLSGLNGPARPGIVHRLDKGTSGVMVVAKTDAAHRHLSEQFARREVDKYYLALVWGAAPEHGQVEANLVRDPHNRVLFRATQARGRSALTLFRALEYFHGFTLLEARPRTGRTHQIRVHLAHLDHPVFGDQPYGGAKPVAAIPPAQRPIVARLRRVLSRPALHAQSLSFLHPQTRKRVTWSAPLPDDFRTALDALRRDSSG